MKLNACKFSLISPMPFSLQHIENFVGLLHNIGGKKNKEEFFPIN
jgi:hypothetical protein